MKREWIAIAAAVIACKGDGGSRPPEPECSATKKCGGGLLCLVTTAGPHCAPPPFGVELVAPDSGTLVGKAGVLVRARVTLAGEGGLAPERVRLIIGGSEQVPGVELKSREGAVLTYEGVYGPAYLDPASVTLWVSAEASGAVIPSEAVVLAVDRVPPELGSLTVCNPCARDELLPISIRVTDLHLSTVEAWVEVNRVTRATTALAPSADPDVWTGALKLRELPFPGFAPRMDVVVKVRARDTYGNEGPIIESRIALTRLRWAADLRGDGAQSLQLTSAAIGADGRVVTGASDQVLRFINPGPPATPEPWAVRAGVLSSSPSSGSGWTWTAGEAGLLVGRDAEGSHTLTCPGPGQATPGKLFTPVVLPSGAALTVGESGQLFWASPPGTCSAIVNMGEPATTAPVVSGGKVFVATTRLLKSVLHRFSVDGSEELKVPTGYGSISAALAVDGRGGIVFASGSGELGRAQPDTLVPTILAALNGAVSSSPIILPDGDIVVGTNDGVLHRLTPRAAGEAWREAWSPPVSLGSAVTGVALTAPAATGEAIYAVTASGVLHALDLDGREVWSSLQDGESVLGHYALTAPALAPAEPDRLPTLYVTSAEGKVYALVVDGAYETASPWPQAHHDARHSGDAGAAP